jgi:hypothetical protein
MQLAQEDGDTTKKHLFQEEYPKQNMG